MNVRAIADEIMEHLNENLANGCCSFCGGNNDDEEHDEGTLCDVLQKALQSEPRETEDG